MSPHCRIHAVCTANVAPMDIDGRRIMSGIGKTAVSHSALPARIAVGKLGLAGDEQADPTVHGGLAKAVYAYPQEHYPFWEDACRRHGAALPLPLPPGALGENLLISGLLEGDVWVGDLIRFPDCLLRVSEARQPCFKFQARMGFRLAPKLMAQSGHCGFYLAVETPGTLGAGDEGALEPGPRRQDLPGLFRLRMRGR